MRALVSIQFALDILDEDELTELVRALDENMRKAIATSLRERGEDWRNYVRLSEDVGAIEWYGATITLRKPVFDVAMEGGE